MNKNVRNFSATTLHPLEFGKTIQERVSEREREETHNNIAFLMIIK